MLFPSLNKLPVKRKQENGGDIVYDNYEALLADFEGGNLHPGDLKPAVATAINALIQPVRDHFKNNEHAKKLLAKIKHWQ